VSASRPNEQQKPRVVSVNPATGEERLLEARETSVDEVLQLSERAANVALDFARRPFAWRARLLRAMADELEADIDHLVRIARRETALSDTRLEGEVRRSAFQFRFFADVVLDGGFLHASIDHSTAVPGPRLRHHRQRPLALPVSTAGRDR
jgi:NADP-dependent aldehyde dehydrogenase